MSDAADYNGLREQRMKELKSQLAEQQEKQRKQAEAETQLDDTLKMLLEPEAKARLANVKLVNSQLYLKTAQVILYLYKTGKAAGKINDEQLKELLKKLSEKKEITIKRK